VRLYGDTDKGEHGYLEYYRRCFGPLRFKRNLVIEIGVGGYESRAAGGSLALWRDYLVRSTIVGIDLADKDIHWGPRVKFVRADQSKREQLRAVVDEYGAPDVVIDDGSHIGSHIRTSFDVLWPCLRPGGIYVIEDLCTSYYPDFGGADPAPDLTGVGLLRCLVDDAQALDPTFRSRPELGLKSDGEYAGVAAVHAYPGIAFIEKAPLTRQS